MRAGATAATRGSCRWQCTSKSRTAEAARAGAWAMTGGGLGGCRSGGQLAAVQEGRVFFLGDGVVEGACVDSVLASGKGWNALARLIKSGAMCLGLWALIRRPESQGWPEWQREARPRRGSRPFFFFRPFTKDSLKYVRKISENRLGAWRHPCGCQGNTSWRRWRWRQAPMPLG
jgi:hypothetical protein